MFGALHRQVGTIKPADGSGQVGAWAVVKGQATNKLHSSYNISSLTDNAAGDFTLTYVRAFAAATNYVTVGLCVGALNQASQVYTDDANVPTATSARILTLDTAGNKTARDPTCIAMIGLF